MKAAAIVVTSVLCVLVGGVLGYSLSRKPCEPVVNVEYRKVGKQWYPETVVHQPVREGGKCVLAEVG